MTTGITHPRVWQLLNFLADGTFHSGEALANKLGISRASVFNALADITQYGVPLHRVRGRGYRLAHPWQRLDARQVSRCLGKAARQFDIEIASHATSSNSVLLQRAALGAKNGSVLAVELQTEGRGRLGRTWYAGLGDALTFSLLWRFDCGLNSLSGLSLAVGVAIIRALNQLGAQDVQLKWPNDILTPHGKLAGVLIEAQGDMLGPSTVVIGIGLNCRSPNPELTQKIAQPVSALEEIFDVLPERNHLLAELLVELSNVLSEFAKNGFSELRAEWIQHHAYQNLPIQLRMSNGTIHKGTARGVNAQGELLLETSYGVQCFNSGEAGVQH